MKYVYPFYGQKNKIKIKISILKKHFCLLDKRVFAIRVFLRMLYLAKQ